MTAGPADLVDKLSEPDFYRYVMELADMGEDACPAVWAGLGHPDWRIRRGCAAVTFFVHDAETLQRVALLTRDPKKKVRKMAVLSLGCGRGQNASHPIDVVPHLAYSALSDPSVRVRRVAVFSLLVQAPERRIGRTLRRVLATESDPKALRVAGLGLERTEAQLAARRAADG